MIFVNRPSLACAGPHEPKAASASRRKPRQSLKANSMIVTPLKKSKVPDFSEARPYRRAGYIRPRRHQFLCRHNNRRCQTTSSSAAGSSTRQINTADFANAIFLGSVSGSFGQPF